ncbi:unnamed protein product [Citrullus colocynthis]|uniref:Uncharacterized protein n=1 Tax=Citrullus colocynthis TaxID=252529 RepID=A0ABP0XW83_9ROSI
MEMIIPSVSYGEYTPKTNSTASTKCIQKLLQKRHDSLFRRNTDRRQLLRLGQPGQTPDRANRRRVSQAFRRKIMRNWRFIKATSARSSYPAPSPASADFGWGSPVWAAEPALPFKNLVVF